MDHEEQHSESFVVQNEAADEDTDSDREGRPRWESKSASWIRKQRSLGRMAINWGKYNPIRMQYLKERTPQKLWLQLFGKSYIGLIYWTALVEFLRNLFWFQLKAGGLAPQLGFLAYLFIPCAAVGRPVFREFLDNHSWSRALLVVGGVFGLWGELYDSAIRRVTLSACGVGLLGIYVWDGMWSATIARRECTAFGMVGGIVLLQVFRWAYGGLNPLVASWWGLLFLCIIPGVCSAFLVLCEDLANSEGEQLESFIEEDEDVEMYHIEKVPSNEGWRYRKLDYSSASGRSLNGHDLNGNASASDKAPASYSLVQNVQPPDTRDQSRSESVKDGDEALNVKFHRPVESPELLGTARVENGNVVLQDGTGGDVAEANTSVSTMDETFEAMVWGFGSDAFLEIRPEIEERDHGETDFQDANGSEKSNETGEQQVESISLSKKTRRARLIDKSYNEAQSVSSPKSGYSPRSVSSPMKNKRWGEGEEVPWSMDVRGDQDISDSELDLYRHKSSKWDLGSSLRTVQMGVGSGSLLFLTHWVFTAPTVFPRWLGLTSHLGWVSILSFALGLVAATEYPRMLCLRRSQSIVFWVFAAIGAVVLMRSNSAAMLGASLLAFAAPSLWISIAQSNLRNYPGWGLGIMIVVYIIFVLWSTSLVAYQAIPALRFLRGTRTVLMGCAVTGIGVGLAREPCMVLKGRASRGGTWRGLFASEVGARGRQAVGALVIFAAVVLSIAFGIRLHHPSHAKPTPGSVKVLNFNVQQGFSRAGTTNTDAVLDMLRKEQAHVIMLQETDLMHIAHGNLDMIKYWSIRLRMHSLYTPPTTSDTWGCAMLSIYPFLDSESGILSSPKGENACYQYARVAVEGLEVHLLNTHFGTIEKEITQQAIEMGDIVNRILNGAETSTPVVLSGDINAAPLSLSYSELTSSGLRDAYVSLNGEWKNPQERDPGAGYIFSSPAANCTSWSEPQYDQQKTADGFPIVSTFKLSAG